MSIFKEKPKNGRSLGALVRNLRDAMNGQGGSFVSQKTANKVLSVSFESLSEPDLHELETEINGFNTALENLVNNFGGDDASIRGLKLTAAQKEAARTGALISADMQGFLASPLQRALPAMESASVMPASGGLERRIRPALEAYDERANKDAVVYTTAYNMQAARQDEFGEAFFPTVTVTPDQVGYTVSMNLVQVYDDFKRDISGDIERNFRKKNVVFALIDPDILKNDTTRLVPVYQDSSANKFVSPSLVAPKNIVTEEGETVSTAPLAIGVSLNLLGLSQTPALIANGLLGPLDALDSAVNMSALYMSFTGTDSTGAAVTEVVKFKSVAQMTGATFTYAPQANYRRMVMNFNTQALPVNSNTTLIDGSASKLLAQFVAGGYSARLAVMVTGDLNLEIADCTTSAGKVSAYEIKDADGNVMDLTTGQGLAFANLFASGNAFGWDVEARRVNSNRREIGQRLDLTNFKMIYQVPLLAPITIARPVTVGDQNDALDLAALITTTHIRTSNAAVAKLLETRDVLAEYISSNSGLPVTEDSEMLGISRFVLTPFFEELPFDVSMKLDSLTTADRISDLHALFINQLRDMVYRAYRDSGYKAAATAINGGVDKNPTVIIGTDIVLAKYLQIMGDTRLFGPEFDVKIVSTMNKNMIGKIIFAFGEFGEKDGVPNPLHFGNMAWKPEVATVLPIARGGQTSKELTVQPSFRHVVNTPIMGVLNVKGIQDVVASKVALEVATVAVPSGAAAETTV
jgi:hypothetical protein